MEKNQFFYLRKKLENGSHRIGGMAIRLNEDGRTFTIAASLCSDDDSIKYDTTRAKNSAMGKLNSLRKSMKVTQVIEFETAMEECGLRTESREHPKSDNFKAVVANPDNALAFNRAFDTLLGIKK